MSGVDYRGKRLLDMTIAVVGLVVTAPIQAAIAVAVRLTSPGPVLHRTRRVGRGGQPFMLYKFRSMRMANGDPGPAVTAQGDPRITKVGRVLRHTKLDELPQLCNVLKGDMGIVGPRPEDQRYVDHYTGRQRTILQWRPGLTSPASIVYRHEEAMLAGAADLEAAYASLADAKLEIDLRYMTTASLSGDLRCIKRTVSALFVTRRSSDTEP